ncbi:hypothetical protein [Chryseobacterium daecheongense]|uniref:Uncharacterized protein n=1 Tax=Chryseobacterium daecheongense TaxID=192389 RepID=A0A3N0W578_9FLAO|nr:hypothetical protein [Chryseobacterium daecheongense]ROI00220.1 hypothetical protein EGI05_04870 [Chryseobacterium daecheongense]TDX94823.1 hypothetical protein BCF50_0594 [Chryseobacterium daecheongense]
MNIVKVSTKNPQQLRDDINDKIIMNEIRSWEYDDTKQIISHKGDQYKDHFYFEYQIDDQKGILEFAMHSSGTSEFADSRAIQLLERMLLSHFEDRIEIL